MPSGFKRLIFVWLALMALLALTCASAFVRMGPWNGAVNLFIAAAKTALVVWCFMHLGSARTAVRLSIAVAGFTLALLFAISAADYATRTVHGAPWQASGGSRQGG
jgi:cytochrome c oxidase subunit 4